MQKQLFRSTRASFGTLTRAKLDEELQKLLSTSLDELVQRFVEKEFKCKFWRSQAYFVATYIDELILEVHLSDDFKLFGYTDDYMYQISESVYSHCEQELRKICDIKCEKIESEFDYRDFMY